MIVGTRFDSPEILVAEHERDLRAVMNRLAEYRLRVFAKRAKIGLDKIEFCLHVLEGDGRLRAAPGNLLALQEVPCPETVTQLRGFLGITNYYSSYVEGYAELAASLTAKLRLNRE